MLVPFQLAPHSVNTSPSVAMKFSIIVILACIYLVQAASLFERYVGNKVNYKYSAKVDLFDMSKECNGARIKSINVKPNKYTQCHHLTRVNSAFIAPSYDCTITVWKDRKCRGTPDYNATVNHDDKVCAAHIPEGNSMVISCDDNSNPAVAQYRAEHGKNKKGKKEKQN